jgi:hypothetical protein
MRRRIVTLALFFLAACTERAFAQATGTVAGRVVDQTGAPLAGVTVGLTAGATTLSAVTDHRGVYRLEPVPAGAIEVTFRLLNFTVVRREGAVASGQLQTVDALLALSLSADVLVTASATFRNVAEIPDPAGSLLGIASSASQGAITAAQLAARPVMRPGEVLETVPGLIVSQHSGEGKANQYYLRGFNLDHGTDFSTTVAGVPVNMPTGAHSHGYSDVSFLIPELVSGVQFKKGPYFADEGDFSAAGAANINYLNRLDRPLVRLSVGSNGWGRGLVAASHAIGGGVALGAVELNRNDGPWLREDRYEKVNGVVRFSRGDNRNGFSVTGMAYQADWNATDQVAQRAVSSGRIARFGFLDGSDRGSTSRENLAADIQRSAGTASLRASAFVLRNRLSLFSNFTYFLNDPVNGDQFEQAERRIATGARMTYRRLGRILGRHAESSLGIQTRHDWLDPIGLYKTARTHRLTTTRTDRVSQTMTATYAQSEIEWARKFRTTLGLRGDVYRYDVTASNSANSGEGTSGLVSPKLSAAIGPWAGTEFYANAGTGFHSNDARGAAISVDPQSGDAKEPVTPLVRAKGAEFGVRTVAVPGLQSTLSVWYLGIASELLFVGDAGTTEAGRPSRRYGVEWTNYWRLKPWLTTDLDLSFSRARFTDDDPIGGSIPGALDRVIAGGVTFEPRRGVFGSLRVRHFGPRPLIEDASVNSRATTLWNAEVGYQLSASAQIVVEGFNLFDARVPDIDYFYRSRLQGEPAEGVADVHTHPALPRSARVGLRFTF